MTVVVTIGDRSGICAGGCVIISAKVEVAGRYRDDDPSKHVKQWKIKLKLALETLIRSLFVS